MEVDMERKVRCFNIVLKNVEFFCSDEETLSIADQWKGFRKITHNTIEADWLEYKEKLFGSKAVKVGHSDWGHCQ